MIYGQNSTRNSNPASVSSESASNKRFFYCEISRNQPCFAWPCFALPCIALLCIALLCLALRCLALRWPCDGLALALKPSNWGRAGIISTTKSAASIPLPGHPYLATLTTAAAAAAAGAAPRGVAPRAAPRRLRGALRRRYARAAHQRPAAAAASSSQQQQPI